MSFGKRNTIFAQSDSTDGLFFIQEGKVQLSVVSEGGKEATLGILSEGDFFGEGGACWPACPHVLSTRNYQLCSKSSAP